MNPKNKKTPVTRKRIADEIMTQIGKSVILVFLIVAAVAICMVAWTIMSSKEQGAYSGIQGSLKPADRIYRPVYKRRGTTVCQP